MARPVQNGREYYPKGGKSLSADLVVLAMGVQPEVELAQKAGSILEGLAFSGFPLLIGDFGGWQFVPIKRSI